MKRVYPMGAKASERALVRYLNSTNERAKTVLAKVERCKKLAKPLWREDDQLRLDFPSVASKKGS